MTPNLTNSGEISKLNRRKQLNWCLMKPLSRSRTGEQLNDILQTEIIFISGILTRIQKKMTKISTRTTEKKISKQVVSLIILQKLE